MARMRKRRKVVSDINVVPYIDVMLVLLLIFMVTAPLMNLGVEIELPSGGPPLEQKEEPLMVTIDKTGAYFLTKPDGEREAMSEAVLQKQIAAIVAQNPKVNVLIAADHEANFGQVYRAMALLTEANAKRIAFMSQPDKGKGK